MSIPGGLWYSVCMFILQVCDSFKSYFEKDGGEVMKILKFIIQELCYCIWTISETLNISLYKLAPCIFNGMIGCCKMKKVNKNKEEN